jgi:hypothetical protein
MAHFDAPAAKVIPLALYEQDIIVDRTMGGDKGPMLVQPLSLAELV